ncbi:MAG: N-acetylmuramoyl-L-alanine amidase [Tabrizicola sp.]|uniref:N-acetylmuramoyl-L-alanine amidase n=1 Tax=Tabrizicola sp. TaxID=2005166 RepID=UPI0027368D23|nr:N-acetylmuramoyl-L-alanine amidase [Tabrizicola sp.]MDP3263438.1 N-acetylmuramoyl-L-alanine amidase [Tabrizicola sp.]MDP3646795.1 N-acetylmuramoyl-L-alanine amidase [Paracoccaceae bacterium]MDZ4065863.1 N-acetylmuramoyl-L-alanine amidase [Tabrizicola sp.]
MIVLVRLALRVLALACVLFPAGGAGAQDLSALARFNPDASSVVTKGDETRLTLALSQPVPWRVRLLDAPPRLVLDVREVDWRGINRLVISGAVGGLRAGVFRPGWSRLVIDLAGPTHIATAAMATGEGGAKIRLTLQPTDAASFATAAARPEPPEWAPPSPANLPPAERRGAGPIVVVLDPGHGGIDPGAERDGHTEAALMLTFARELKDLLLRDGRFTVVMTRDGDVFVPLEARISIAREARADLFLSLHADALSEGEAQGATVYSLSADASDEAAAALAERHDRDDLLAGIDLTAQDDLVAEVLMDMARTETAPRTDRLADSLVAAIKGAGLKMHRHPRQQAGFSVLKSPDIPSLLLEVGFLSSARDLKRITDPRWRAQMAEAVLQGILTWSEADAAVRAVAAP